MSHVSVEAGVLGADDFARDAWLAVEKLGGFLDRGVLSLFLGAGVSSGFGLPRWPELVARVIGAPESGPEFEKIERSSEKEMMRLVDEVDDETVTYLSKVSDALYRDVSVDLAARFQRSPLLLAVAALTTGSVRGRIETIVTYNYDDLLEQYLRMLGYSVRSRLSAGTLRERCDVEINHVHGYLPQDGQDRCNPSDLVLSGKRYRERRAFIDKDWSDFVKHQLLSKVGLFLGLSGNDDLILDIVKRAQGEAESGSEFGGYWLMTPTAFERNADQIRGVGMCPLKLTAQEFPSFILGICQKAAG